MASVRTRSCIRQCGFCWHLQPSGGYGAGRIFEGVTFVCDPRGRVIAKSRSNSQDEMLVVDLNASDLAEIRLEPEGFFRHFRRGELYRNWESNPKIQ